MDTSQHQESGPERAADEPVSAPHRRRRGVWVTTAAAVALGLAVTGGAVAGAATGSSTTSTTPDHHGLPGGHGGFGGAPPAAFGTVKSVGTDTFTLTAHDGTTVTVDVGSSTTYTDPSVSSPTFSTVKVGDHVAAFGADTSNTVTATKVAIGGPGGPGGPGSQGGPGMGGFGGHGGFGGAPPAAFGTVKSVGTDAFTLTVHDGTTVTVDVSSSTKYMEFGKASATLSDVTVGTQVVVFGTDTSNTVTATSVGIGGQGNGPSGSFHPGGPGWRPSSGAPSGSSGGTAWGNAGLN